MSNRPKYTLELYTIDTASSEFNFVTEITRYESLNISRKNNDIGSLVVTFNLYDDRLIENLFTRYRTKVLLKRNDYPLYVFYVYKKSINLSPDSNSVTITCYDYLHYLQKRFVKSITHFKDTEIGEIAMSLIDTMQAETNGEYMIREGTIETTETRNETYEKFTLISDAIQRLANINGGYDFEFRPVVDADGRLTEVDLWIWASRGSLKENVILSKETILVNNATDYVEIANTVYGVGFGSGDNVLESTASNDSLQQAYTVLETTAEFKGVSLQTTLDDQTEDFLTRNEKERFYMSITVRPNIYEFGDFDLNDFVRYDFTNYSIPFLQAYGQGTARIEKIDINIDKEGVEFISPYLDFS